MVVVRPFQALRPKSELASQVASPPYDVLDSAEAREMAAGSPLSFLHVVKPEIDLPPGTDLYSDEVYEKGAENLRAMIDSGTMIQDFQPFYYFYRQIMGQHSQTGLVATVSAEDYMAWRIKRHEFTRPEKEADRVKHIMAQGAQCGPVFLTYPDIEEINSIQEDTCSGEPMYDFTADDGVRHTVWKVSDELDMERIRQIFGDTGCLYVADGHHRSAAGTTVANQRNQFNPEHTGTEEYNFFLAVIFPKSHMKIMAYNRAVMDLNNLGQEEFMNLLADRFIVTASAAPEPGGPGNISMYIGGEWYGLVPKPGTYPAADPVKSIDASILQENLLAPILGIGDPRTDKRIKFIGGIRGTGELERLVDSGGFAVAFSMPPVSLDQLFAVADSGNVMPPKCTWFEPKLRSGLLVHLI